MTLVPYPLVQQELDWEYELKEHQMSLKTIYLNQNREDIHRDVLKINGWNVFPEI